MTPDRPNGAWLAYAWYSKDLSKKPIRQEICPVRTIAIMQRLDTGVGYEYVEMQQQFHNDATARKVIMSAESVTQKPWHVSAYRVVAPADEATQWLTVNQFILWMDTLLGVS
jgi:hypothetical protein